MRYLTFPRTRPRAVQPFVIIVLAAYLLLVAGVRVTLGATFNVAAGDVAGLIAAINSANTSPGPDTIELADSIYTLTAVNNTTDDNGPPTSNNGLPSISSAITINGHGATIQRSIASATPLFRIFHIDSTGSLTLNQVTVANGNVAHDGGGILNRGTLLVNQSAILNNQADFGGGVVTHEVSTTAVTTIINSTIAGNRAIQLGGGVHAGGLTAQSQNFIVNSTIANNTTQTGGGGGIFLTSDTDVSLQVKNSIVAGNTGSDCGTSGGRVPVSLGVNFDTDGTCGFTTSSALNLGALAENGGPTQTIALGAGSVAIDAVTDCTDLAGTTVSTDQRGVTRPQGPRCDAGAFELVAAPPAPNVSAILTDVLLWDSGKPVAVAGVSSAGDVLEYRALIANDGTASASGVTFTATLTGGATLVAGSVTTSQGTVGAGVTVNIGNLEIGGKVVITYWATRGVGTPGSTGTVSGGNFANVTAVFTTSILPPTLGTSLTAPVLHVRCLHDPIWSQTTSAFTLTADALNSTLASTTATLEIWIEGQPNVAPVNAATTTRSFTSGASFTYSCFARQGSAFAWSGWRTVQVGTPSSRAIPVLQTGAANQRVDFVFIPDSDNYTGHSDPDFLTDIHNVIRSAYYSEALYLRHQDKLNFWIAQDTGDAEESACSLTAPSGWNTADYSFADAGAIVHTDVFFDCAQFTNRLFSSEPSRPRDVLHESGHVPFGLADEYPGRAFPSFLNFGAYSSPNVYSTVTSTSAPTCEADAPNVARATTACGGVQEQGKPPSASVKTSDPRDSDTVMENNDLMADKGPLQALDIRRINWVILCAVITPSGGVCPIPPHT